MKEFKEKWLKELDEAVPKLSQDVLDAPILVGAEDTPQKRKFNLSWKWITVFASLATAILLTVLLSIFVFGGNTDGAPPTVSDSYFAVLEVNPEVVFTVDDNSKVLSVTALNSDADVIIADESRLKSLIGVSFEDSVKIFIDYCAKLGYLKMDQSGAVKITHSGKDETLASAVSGIENYFKEKGIFSLVVTAKASVKEISSKLKLGELQTFDDVVGALKQLPSLFSEREALGKTIEEIQSAYKETVILGDMQDYIIEKLRRGLISGQKLEEIYDLNETVKAHQDNPLLLIGGLDYWALQSLSVEFTAELNGLLAQMADKLQEFENSYGVILDSLLLNANYLLYSVVDKQFVTSIIESDDENAYLESLPLIKALFVENGVELDFEEDFDVLPTSKEEFSAKNANYLSQLYDVCVQDNKALYETQRESISDGDYQAFLNEITSEFGSLENYWASLKSVK